MRTEIDVESLSRDLARTGQRASALGALVLLFCFAGAIWTLFSLSSEVAAKKAQIDEARTNLHVLSSSVETLKRENEALRAEKARIKSINQGLEKIVNLQQGRKYQESLEKAQVLLNADPQNEVVLAYAAHASFQLGDMTNAVRFAHEAIRIDPAYFDPYLPFINAQYRLGNSTNASVWLSWALEQRVERLSIILSRKRYLDDLWTFPEARRVIESHSGRLKAIQTGLKAYGFYSGPGCKADGSIGPKSLEAIEAFCRLNNIKQPVTVSQLLASLSYPKKPQPSLEAKNSLKH